GASAKSVVAGIRAQTSTGDGLVRGETLVSPMQGTVVRVTVEEGQEVAAGDVVAVVEAMKMENPVRSHTAGVVRDMVIKAGDSVAQDAAICRVTAAE
ncbi:MAG: biotin/lipoyl-binding protein, partial [Actinomycetota bacterium]|nr:biotin/lipoyl-binding protein [Actinomycetota bacterium]